MDRSKLPGGSRPPKPKMGLPHHGSEIFALGSKSSSARDDAKSKVMATSKGTIPDRKREGSSTSLAPGGIKKPKLGGPSLSVPGPSKSSFETAAPTVQEYWEQIAIECEPVDFITTVLAAIDQQDSDTVVAIVCGAIKLLISARSKPDSLLSLSFLYLAKIRPNLFCNDIITQALSSILKRDTQHAFKGRNNPGVHIMAANLLARGYQDKKQWPEIFLKVYIDDAINERVWVDYDDCSAFVENICTAFGTKTPPKSMLQPELSSLNQPRDSLGIDGEESGDSSNLGESFKSSDLKFEHTVQPRYAHITAKAEKLVLDTIKEQLNRRQAPDCSTRNFLKFLANTSGLPEVRALAVTRLELWIHNGKLNKPAQELLTYICYNVSGQLTKDHEVLANLVKMRLKTKPLINIYMICLKEMINLQPDILLILLKYVVQNELSNARNPNNMGMLANMFQAKPDESARYLAEIYQEFLLQREDCLRTLRVFLRELVKMLRYDINLVIFCKSLMNIRDELQQQITTFEFKDRVFMSIVDLICLSMFLSGSPQIREANVSMKNGRDKGSTILFNFYTQMSTLHRESLTWMHQIVPILFQASATDYAQALHKLLLLDTPEQYSKGDQWPPEPERVVLLRLVSEVPLHQDSILIIILIGITKEIPFSIPDSMEIIEQIVRRAAGLKYSDYPPLEANKLEMIDFFFSMAEYHYPEKIVLPSGYDPPKLAISALFWKACNILLMLSAHNPGTFGSYCWEHYPILRNLMEICITNQFNEMRIHEEELQICALERSQILDFEKYLAAATSKVVITEQTSLLLSQLMLMDPMGIPRRPPLVILEQIKNLNASHKLGHLLCRSRQPDLLLDIIHRHGTSQSLPWLADLVQNSDGDFNHLPVQCLCEFLLSNSNIFNVENARDTELLAYLQNLLREDPGGQQTSAKILEYFLRRLSSTSKHSRFLAIKALKLLLAVFHPTDEMELELCESDWLLRQLPSIPHFVYIRPMIVAQLRAACQVENCPELIMIFIQFIAAQTLHDTVSDMLEHVMDMSQLIVERSTVFSYIIPTGHETNDEKIQTLNCLFVMFNNFLIKLREQTGTQTWPEYPDLLMVHFHDGVQSPIHLNIIQAFVILLTYSPLIPGALQIIDYWFPVNFPPPQAFAFDTQEPVQILPDWLKLKMIRSPVERLVDIAISDLTPDQIVLFIQNFGTPIASMSKLLALLDRAVIEQFDTVKSSVLNTAYLAKLIEIQQSRGAKNGHIAVRALGLHGPVAMETTQEFESQLEPLKFPTRPPKSDKPAKSDNFIIKTKEIDETIEAALAAPQMDKVSAVRFRRIVQQLISRDNKKDDQLSEFVSTKILNYLYKICKSQHAVYFFQNLKHKSALYTLFRCLLENTPEKLEHYNYLLQVIDECIKFINPKTHDVLFQILLNRRKMLVKNPRALTQAITPKLETFDRNEHSNFIEIFNNSKSFDIEKKGQLLFNRLFKTSNSKILIESLSNLLKMVEYDEKQADKKGLLVDWLAESDSELISLDQNIQMDLLFSSSLRQFRFYMLSLLSHQASWETLHKILNKLLDSYNPDYDQSSVLDFITAITNNPKLWQGRDKATPKHEQMENVFSFLNEKEIYTLIDYILHEPNNKISQRISLLIKCMNIDTIRLKTLISYVQNTKSGSLDVKTKFLQTFYANNPSIKFLVEDDATENMFIGDLTALTGCPADKIIQYVVTAIASLSNQREFQQMSQDTEYLLRKLAASHPSLFLRQLQVLSGLLQGRAHMEFHVLRQDYHISLFNQVLSLYELLQPQIFEDPYRVGLQNGLKCYFDLLRYHEPGKDIYPIMCHFMDFLQSYVHINSPAALKFIDPHMDLIQDLEANYRHCLPIRQLVQGVLILKHKTESNKKTKDTEDVKSQDDDDMNDIKPSTSSSSVGSIDTTDRKSSSITIQPYTKSHLTHPQWNQLAQAVQRKQIDDIIPILQDIETITSKRPGLLTEIFEKILELIFSATPNVRVVAHHLLVRVLKHNPGQKFINTTILTAYMQCLTHEDIGITTTALETLVDIVLCLQEYAIEILTVVFYLGISSKLNTLPYIKKCMSTLKLQHAC